MHHKVMFSFFYFHKTRQTHLEAPFLFISNHKMQRITSGVSGRGEFKVRLSVRRNARKNAARPSVPIHSLAHPENGFSNESKTPPARISSLCALTSLDARDREQCKNLKGKVQHNCGPGEGYRCFLMSRQAGSRTPDAAVKAHAHIPSASASQCTQP
jgi:hypothetical protein